MTNFPKLEGKLAEKGIKKKVLAEYLGIAPITLYFKMTGRNQFSLAESIQISELLDVPVEELFRKREEEKR